MRKSDVESQRNRACTEDSCYVFKKEENTWKEARTSCQQQKGDLVSIETEEEWDFIKGVIKNYTNQNSTTRWQVGLEKKAGKWIWVTGRPLTTCKWGKNQSNGNGDVASITWIGKNQTILFDVPRNTSGPFICEITKGTGHNNSQGICKYVGIPCELEYGKRSWEQNCKFSAYDCKLNCTYEAPSDKFYEEECDETFNPYVQQCSYKSHAGEASSYSLSPSPSLSQTPLLCKTPSMSPSPLQSPSLLMSLSPSSQISSTSSSSSASLAKSVLKDVDSKIIFVAMYPKPKKLRESVILKFRDLKGVEGRKVCAFWSGFRERSASDGFSEEGCHPVTSERNSEETICSCNHLTHFAVLVDYNSDLKLTGEDETILENITYVGLSLSIVGILLTIILYSFLTDVREPLSQIQLSLSVSLGAGQMIFLAGINATENTAACVTAAVFMQYFMMAAFFWMLVEGVYLYLLVVKAFNIYEKMHMYHVMSWGIFISPVLNIFILVQVIREMTTLVQPLGKYNHIQQIRLDIKTCAVMVPLLGFTWLFGLFLPIHKAFAYIFTIFNSMQGFLIFAFHCVRNSQIREQFKRKMNTIFPSTADHGDSIKKSTKINPSGVSDMRAIELQ
ncbi:putative G-protein coupled receptor 133 [Stylophora pistillata]|uniref:Putative G-protein coupled receptor 133 n=1 Tax=Stylophora pistillata TaxID=50429 RepID=A0A2B4R6K6_STYPI|nr:putative G-protein coupled receptor 133 [Stylophora pistillata]